MPTAGSPAPGLVSSSQSRLIIICCMNQGWRSEDFADPSVFFSCSPYCPTSGGCYKHPVRSRVSKIWSTFSANRCQLLSSFSSSSFRILCLLRILQQKLNFADKLPRAFLKIYSFCEKMSLSTFLPPKSMRCSSRCRVCGPELGLAGAVLHQAGLRAAASAIGGSSFQPHPGHASQGGGVKFPSTAALTSPAP